MTTEEVISRNLPGVDIRLEYAPFVLAWRQIIKGETSDWRFQRVFYRYAKMRTIAINNKTNDGSKLFKFTRKFYLSKKYGHVRTIADLSEAEQLPPLMGNWTEPEIFSHIPPGMEGFPAVAIYKLNH